MLLLECIFFIKYMHSLETLIHLCLLCSFIVKSSIKHDMRTGTLMLLPKDRINYKAIFFFFFFLLFRPYFFSCIMTSRLLKGLVPTVNRLRVCPRFSVFRPIIHKRNFIATIPRWTSGEGFYSNYLFKAFQ